MICGCMDSRGCRWQVVPGCGLVLHLHLRAAACILLHLRNNLHCRNPHDAAGSACGGGLTQSPCLGDGRLPTSRFPPIDHAGPARPDFCLCYLDVGYLFVSRCFVPYSSGPTSAGGVKPLSSRSITTSNGWL